MARKTGGLFTGLAAAAARTISGAIAADSATLTDANFPAASGFSCQGYDTILVGAEIAGGASPTATIELLFRDEEAADGSRWKRLLLGARDGITAIGAVASETTGALGANSDFVELRCYGASLVIPRVTAVTNSAGTTSLKILVLPGRQRLRRDHS